MSSMSRGKRKYTRQKLKSESFYRLSLDEFCQRDFAAFRAIALRFLLESFLALAFPPFNPPLRPIAARYSDKAKRFGVSSVGSSVESRTVSVAN
jgi:hypothetical protein